MGTNARLTCRRVDEERAPLDRRELKIRFALFGHLVVNSSISNHSDRIENHSENPIFKPSLYNKELAKELKKVSDHCMFFPASIHRIKVE